MNDQPIFQTSPRISCRATIGALLRVLQKDYVAIIKASALPVLLAFVIAVAFGGLNPVTQIAYSMMLTWSAVALARLMILNERTSSWLPYIGKPSWHYFWRISLLYFANSLLTAPVLFTAIYYLRERAAEVLPLVALFVFIPIALFIFGRFGLAPIAAAVEGDDHFKTAWKKTSGNTLRLMALRIIPILPLIASIIILSALGAKMVTAIVTVIGMLMIPMVIIPVLDALIYVQLYQGREIQKDVA